MMENIENEEFDTVNLDEKAITVQAAAVQYSEKMASYVDAMSTLPTEWHAR